MRFWKFLQYNNAVPIALSILVLGGGSVFAATDPDAIYSAQKQILSIDNTYLTNKDLSAYSPRAQITAVTEDAENYYVAYNLSTIDLVDGIWQDITKQLSLKVSKAALGGDDLGLFVARQLNDNVASELKRLIATQDIERKNVTQKVVATVYGGLIGKMLDSSTETLPGYTPVIAPATSSIAVAAVAVTEETPAPVLAPTSPTLTQAEIEALIQEQVNTLLAQHNATPTPTPTPTPAPTPTPTPEPTPAPAPTSTSTSTSTPIIEPDPVPEPVATDTATSTEDTAVPQTSESPSATVPAAPEANTAESASAASSTAQ